MSWDLLKNVYKKEGMVLSLGAGVSNDSRLPNWKGLLRRLVADLIGNGDEAIFDELEENDFPLPVIASLLQKHCPEKDEFIERVREALYRDFDFFRKVSGKATHGEFVRFIRKNNSTLRAVASLCAIKESGKRIFSPNPHIHAIVTFNFDPMLQGYVYGRYRKRLLRTVERASASLYPGRINVYHMHGVLRFDERAGDLRGDAPDKRVLTEQDYFDTYNEPTGIFNYTFLYLLREFSCLFIGLSMQDENLRRLLHYSKKEREQALSEQGADKAAIEEKTLRHFAILRRSGQEQIDEFRKDSLLLLGTRVLWIDEFFEIPERMKDLYETTGDAWKGVY